jgi:hypothetical protein
LPSTVKRGRRRHLTRPMRLRSFIVIVIINVPPSAMICSQLESILSSGLNGNHLSAASTVGRCKPYPQSARIGTLRIRFGQHGSA